MHRRIFFPMNSRCFYKGYRGFSINRGNTTELGNGKLSDRDSCRVPEHFLRGRKESLMDLCPKFRNSQAPILFHLPDRTISRIVESLPPQIIAETFVANGGVQFGMDDGAVRLHLPRWSVIANHHKARRHMTILGELLCSRHSFIPDTALSNILRVSGNLRQANMIDDLLSNKILRVVLPMCLDRLSLSRRDIYNILYGLNRINLSADNAIVYPLISNFAHWYLERNRRNQLRRIRASREKRDIENFISS